MSTATRDAAPRWHALLLTGLAAWLAGVSNAAAQTAASPIAEHYRGRSINMIIGYSVGGGFDLYARVLARHLGRHIPGNPTIVPQNMPGAASLKATEFLLTVAPREGYTIGTFSHTMPIAPLLGTAKLDIRQLNWIGSMASETSLCIASGSSSVKTWADLATKPFTAGGTGRGSDPDMMANLLKTLFGLPIKLVSGYPGTAEIALATERGEVDGFCGLSWSTLTSRYGDWLGVKKVSLLVQANLQKSPQLPDVPLLLDLARNDRERQILTLLVAPQAMARPFAMPPGTPPARVAAMRSAFAATLADPELLADARAAKIEISPMQGPEMEALIGRLHATPPDVQQQAIVAFGG